MSEQNRNEAERRILAGRTWEEFCDLLREAGRVVLDPEAPEDAFDRAEGYRYLGRLLRAGLESFVEHADPLAPEFRCITHETIKMGADNPDNRYLSAPISGKHRYRVYGQRGTVHYLGFGTQAGNYGATGSLETTGYVEAKDLQIAGDGTFELIVSSEPQPGNWLPMREDSGTLIVRQTFLDREHEVPAELHIERIDGPHRPRHATPESIDRGLIGAARFVVGCSRLFHQWAVSLRRHTNRLPMFDPAVAKAAGGDPNIVYYHGYWRLQPDQALLIEATPPECDYWNFQLNNHWMESLDYRYFRICINKHTARYRPDGSVRIVVAHEDPGTENWIETCGHDRGTMCWRWIRAREHPEPRTRVVPLAAVRAGEA